MNTQRLENLIAARDAVMRARRAMLFGGEWAANAIDSLMLIHGQLTEAIEGEIADLADPT